jgi:hypothetical protein
MKKTLAVVSAVYCIFAVHTGVFAQSLREVEPPAQGPPAFVARVDVVVDVPESIEHVFQNCLLKELRALADVRLTRDNPQYRITVMALPNKTQDEVIGFTFSILVTRPFDINALRPLLMSDNLGEHEKRLLFVLGSNYEKIEKKSLLTCPPEELGRVCSEIVAGFNKELLEKDRRLWNSAFGIPQQPPEAP